MVSLGFKLSLQDASSVTILGDFLLFRQAFKAFGNNYFTQLFYSAANNPFKTKKSFKWVVCSSVDSSAPIILRLRLASCSLGSNPKHTVYAFS